MLRRNDDGFTLIELLVVMIIIGILAAVAIPIFLNQQKTARDTSTTSDIKNVVTNVQSGIVAHPRANCFSFLDTPTSTPTCPHATTWSDVSTVHDVTSGKVLLYVGTTATDGVITEVSVSKGTSLTIWGNTASNREAAFAVRAWNDSGKSYLETAPLRYDSGSGRLQQE